VIAVAEHVTVTEVMVGAGGGVVDVLPLLLPPLPQPMADTKRQLRRANLRLRSNMETFLSVISKS
jgi:hypothetical protein